MEGRGDVVEVVVEVEGRGEVVVVHTHVLLWLLLHRHQRCHGSVLLTVSKQHTSGQHTTVPCCPLYYSCGTFNSTATFNEFAYMRFTTAVSMRRSAVLRCTLATRYTTVIDLYTSIEINQSSPSPAQTTLFKHSHSHFLC